MSEWVVGKIEQLTQGSPKILEVGGGRTVHPFSLLIKVRFKPASSIFFAH